MARRSGWWKWVGFIMASSESQSCALPADEPVETVFRELLRTLGLLLRVQRDHYTRFGISEAQWRVLWHLRCAELEGEPSLQQRDLSRRMLIRPPSVTSTVDRLERLGLLVRRTAEYDLRVKQMMLTEQGRQLVEEGMLVHHRQIVKVMGGLTADEQEQFDRLLGRLGEHLAGLADAAGY
jgi:DNA-binding MarR family transcriptional regulator